MNPHSRDRLFAAARAGWGAVLVLWPDAVVGALSGRTPTTATRVVARVLGARHLAQAAAASRWQSQTARDLGLTTDMLHALTGLAFASVQTPWRRGALVDASLAAAFAATSATSTSTS